MSRQRRRRSVQLRKTSVVKEQTTVAVHLNAKYGPMVHTTIFGIWVYVYSGLIWLQMFHGTGVGRSFAAFSVSCAPGYTRTLLAQTTSATVFVPRQMFYVDVRKWVTGRMSEG